MFLRMMVFAATGVSVLMGVAAAQKVVQDVEIEVIRRGGPAASGGGAFHETITGAPYAGESVTETVRMLADGTRIAKKESHKIWRDSRGRTREETIVAGARGEFRVVTIVDPVAEVSYTLNERDKTAVKRRLPNLDKLLAEAKPGEGVIYRSTERRETVVESSKAGGADEAGFDEALRARAPRFRLDVPMTTMTRGGMGGKPEALGTQTMEGLRVEGTRETHTIAAGEIGNDRPLVTVTERWVSPELKVVVRSTTKDPQTGESTYRLTGISRAEPVAALFEVPAGYTVEEANQQIRIERFESK